MTAAARLDAGVLRPRKGLLLGGSPLRVLRLSPAGVLALDGLLAGHDVAGADALRRRLMAAQMLVVEPGPGDRRSVTVVVPVLGTPRDVQPVLDSVPADVRVIVVDDGSPRPVELASAEVLRRPTTTGPSAARNAGARLVTTPLIAFVDAGMTLPAGCLDRLAGHFTDVRVVAAAPRICSAPAPGLLGVVEQRLSSLDMGDSSAAVRPGSRVPYVPSAVLVVRRSAFESVGGFAEQLRVGEDVDLVWRLASHGSVRYDAGVVALHPPRQSLRAALQRRFDYGTSAGQLDTRHPGQVRHLVLSPWFVLPWLAALAHPAGGPFACAVLLARGPSAMPELPAGTARHLVGIGLCQAVADTGRYAIRPALPVTVLAALAWPPARRLVPLLAVSYLAAVRRDLRGGWAPAVLRLAVDVTYSAGVWWSCVQQRRWRPLVPTTRPSARDGVPGADPRLG